MTYDMPLHAAGGSDGRDAVTAMSTQLRAARVEIERRIQRVIASLPPDDPQAQFLRTLLTRLPRNPDGTLDMDSVDTLVLELEGAAGRGGGGGRYGGGGSRFGGGAGGGGGGDAGTAARGAPRALVDALPTRAFKRDTLPSAAGRREEHLQCMVCLSEYEEGEVLRTLPCLHAFHAPCIDKWLAANTTCPLCRFPVNTPDDGGAPTA